VRPSWLKLTWSLAPLDAVGLRLAVARPAAPDDTPVAAITAAIANVAASAARAEVPNCCFMMHVSPCRFHPTG
jgi:hypothetical protein